MQIYIAKSGQQTGPFTQDQVQAMLNSGTVALTDSAWHEGLASWQPLSQVLNVSPPLPTVPPPPAFGAPYVAGSTATASNAASFGIRLGAYIIDAIITYAVAFILGFMVGIVGAVAGASGDTLRLLGGLVGLLSSW